MDRRSLIATLGSVGVIAALTKFLNPNFSNKINDNDLMPALFVGHGSPMNALLENIFTKNLKNLSKEIPKPNAVLCISAHWLTEGSWVTYSSRPKTIHDFYNFPDELYKINYAADGNPELANLMKTKVPSLNLDRESWGLDHGCWTVLTHLYPQADIPVLQLSIDMKIKNMMDHYELAQKLLWLRKNRVLVIGSGNIVHNLNQIDSSETAKPYEWALDFDNWVKQQVDDRNFLDLIKNFDKVASAKLSVPTIDHYLPLVYILGLAQNNESIKHFNQGFQHASISMRGIQIG